MTAPERSPDAGFTLMEALVAMAILAIAAAGLVRATQAHVDQIRGLQLRAMAQWVAENHMAELHAGAVSPTGSASAQMLGQAFTVATATRPTDDPDLVAVRISVSPQGSVRPIASLDGFMDVGTDR